MELAIFGFGAQIIGAIVSLVLRIEKHSEGKTPTLVLSIRTSEDSNLLHHARRLHAHIEHLVLD
jgi:hypothetical protein